MMPARLSTAWRQAFEMYFSVADELDGGLTLDDLDHQFVSEAKTAADEGGLPWPPDLAFAEETMLDLIDYDRRARRMA